MEWKDILGWGSEQIDELRMTGFSFLREGHYKKAILFFEGLVVLNPSSPYDIQTLGALYLEIGETKKALKMLDRALLITPSHQPTLLNKVKALLSLNQRAEALEIAKILTSSADGAIANDATALVMAYS